MLMVLLVGVACGIFAVAWNNDPRHTAIKIAGILGICLNAFFLLMVCGAAHCG
ncbi:MAG TPA: hypothetical protein VFE47_06855 [Tepidisphaeraceae bacterium]|jgi:hypothetical protein|nr:hypothetical protein [Tepidisphaeraceae bacterium]